MSYDLRCFGWESCVIPHSLKAIQTLIPQWNDLKILRHKTNTPHGKTKPDELQLLNQFFKNAEKKPYMPGYTKTSKIGDGSYAHIYLGKRGVFFPMNDKTDGIVHISRDVPMDEICIKEVSLKVTRDEQRGSPQTRKGAYADEIRAILHEAFLHALVLKVFEHQGLPKQVPFLHEVVGLTKRGHSANSPDDFEAVWIVMELLRGQTLENYLKRHLEPHEFEANEKILIDILVQLAHYLRILQKTLRFNHRDMKLNNLYVRAHESRVWTKSLEIPDFGSYKCQLDLTLLDFGFSCIGCEMEGTTLVSAGSWFDEGDRCFKPGRDLCTFLYALHSVFPLPYFVSPAFYSLLRQAMSAKQGQETYDLLRGVDIQGTPNTSAHPLTIQFHQGIYKFLSKDNVEMTGCEPSAFLKALHEYMVAELP